MDFHEIDMHIMPLDITYVFRNLLTSLKKNTAAEKTSEVGATLILLTACCAENFV